MPHRPAAPDWRTWLILVIIAGFLLIVYNRPRPGLPPPLPRAPGPTAGVPVPLPVPDDAGYLFCTWNVENFYDDHDDPRNNDEDEDWFGRNPRIVAAKVRMLADALLLQNGGRGPDILAMVEVENRRAVELLRDQLNGRLSTADQYQTIVQRDNLTGRRFGPAILSRLPARDGLTRTFGGRRILESHLVADGVPLVILVSHWTSRLRGGNEDKREAYAEVIYRAFLDLRRADPAVDCLISGDFNDGPDDPSVRIGLRTTANPDDVRAADPKPRLLDLMAGRDPGSFGTYYYRSRWEVLDHVIATPGLLDDRGWSILPATLRVAHPPELRAGRAGAPWRFGNPADTKPRGPSDHFAINVRLRVATPTTD
jgi:endonuclease/exonuclease/phosphatase family metal-dependent hydrolase